LSAIPEITAEQKEALFTVARSLNKKAEREIKTPQRAPWDRSTTITPGDEYNHRGDVFELLRAHGWHAVSQELWRRPGKDRGVSATWDRVPGKFYVFSSNCHPLENESSYSPFALYAFLECGGDFAEAGRRLREEGYGGDNGIDMEQAKAAAMAVLKSEDAKRAKKQAELEKRLEAIEEHAQPTKLDVPKRATRPVPPHLLHPPGLTGEFSKWIEANAYMPQPWLSVASALAAMSVLCGKRYSFRGQRSNLFIIAAAPSSSGKENGRKCIKKLFATADCMELIGHERVSSDKAILTVVSERGRVLFPWDEVGHMFVSNKNATKSPHLQNIAPTLMTLYSSAGQTYMGMAYADSKDNLDPIKDPHVCIYGTTTPMMLKKCFTADDAESGWMGRVLFFQSFDEPDAANYKDIEPPDEIVNFVRERCAVQGGTDGLFAGVNKLLIQPEELRCTEAASRLLKELEGSLIRKKRAEDMESMKALIGKGYEMALRVCICLAVGCNSERPEITVPIAKWAGDLIEYLIEQCLGMADQNIQRTKFEEDCDRVLEKIQKAGAVGIRRRNLQMTCRKIGRDNSRKDFDDVIAELMSREQIESEVVRAGNRSAVIFRTPSIVAPTNENRATNEI
jgi:hypothetical protein